MNQLNSHQSNEFAKYILEYHQGAENSVAVKVDVVKAFTMPIQRQAWEGVEIR